MVIPPSITDNIYVTSIYYSPSQLQLAVSLQLRFIIVTGRRIPLSGRIVTSG